MADRSTDSGAGAGVRAGPPPARPQRGDLLSVQYLRALAAIAVLAFHAAERAGGAFGPGAAGVDIFFVISGFIMWVIAAKRPPTPADFLARRAGRIVPLYWLVTFLLVGTYLAAPGLFPNLKPSPSHVLQSLAFIPHRDPTGLVAPVLVPGWTLNYEVFFYLVFAVALAVPGKARLWALTGLLGLLAVVGLVLQPTGPIAATYTSPLLLEFLAGAWIGKAWNEGRAAPFGLALALVLAGLLGFAAVAVSGIDVERWRLVVWGVPAMMIVAGAVGLERAGRVPNWPLAKFLGDSSYSLYLAHGLAISFAAKICGLAGFASGPVLFVASVAAGLAAGSACYLLVERPMLKLFHRRPQPRLAKAPLPVTS